MPFGKWESFEDCVDDFVSQGKTAEQAKRICGALKARLEKNSSTRISSWEGDIAPREGNLISGEAMHPIKTLHPEEWPNVRVYLDEELRKAASSLVGAPLLLDHVHPLDGKVLDAEYANGAVKYLAELNDEQVLDWIRKGVIKHCSVEYDWGALERVNGVAPKDVTFQGLALLKDFLPGDPFASVKVWEAVVQRLKEAKKMNEQNDEEEKLRKAQQERAEKYGISPKEGGHLTKPKEYRDIPDDQFADPVNYHYPVDKEHVQAALTYFNQVNNRQAGGYNHGESVKIMAKIVVAALNKGIEVSWQPKDPVYRNLPENLKRKLAGYEQKSEAQKTIEALQCQVNLLMDEKKTLEEKITALKSKAKVLENEKADLAKRLGEAVIDSRAVRIPDLISRKRVVEMLESVVPPRQVIFSHGQTGGFRRLVDEITRLKREIEEAEA